jgi:hypothetical protein
MVLEGSRQGCEKSPLVPGRCAGVSARRGAVAGAACELGPQPLGQCDGGMTQSTWYSDTWCTA